MHLPLVKLVVAALPLPGTTPKAVAAAQSFQRKKVINYYCICTSTEELHKQLFKILSAHAC